MLLVYGPRSTSYDFGAGHPLTPLRFGPGIDLLRSLGAKPGLAPEPAPDDELLWCHAAAYIAAVKRLSNDPSGRPEAGIGRGGDDPAFAGMHEAGAMVAGGSIRAMEAILRGDHEHAFQPGGGLHHAMADRAAGFCIYDDPALAIARARRDGLRVLYLDFDVHHGDGVQTLFYEDPGVLTVSFHESGRYLFPGTGFLDEVGEGTAAGTAVNVPMEPMTGEAAWLEAVLRLVPELAAAFGPDLVVSQHGSDSHAWDPLAHLRVTTTAMDQAARIVDLVAHRFAGGRWLATGGGGYDAYRVVPRAWSLVWLAGEHREVPESTDVAWRERWAAAGVDYGQAPPPERFLDAPNAGLPLDWAQEQAEDASRDTMRAARALVVPRLLREAHDRGWWSTSEPAAHEGDAAAASATSAAGTPTILPSVDRTTWEGLELLPRIIAPADAADAHRLVARALDDGARVAAAVSGSSVVGLAITDVERELMAIGVAPGHRRQGLGSALIDAAAPRSADLHWLAERDPLEPDPPETRRHVRTRLLERAGLTAPAGTSR